jgi:hypothetical protein
MKHTREQKCAALLAQAQALIEEFLDWEEQAERPNLTQIEDVALALRARFGQELAATAIADQDAQQPAAAAACPTCAAALRDKGQKALDAESRLGRLEFTRGYYYCARCHSGLFPLDHQLELWDGCWSAAVARLSVWLGGLVASYREAETILRQVGGINISRGSIWQREQLWGAQLAALAARERQQATALPEQWAPPSRAAVTDQRMGVALDGALVNIKAEGWKELKVGAVFEVVVEPTPDEQSGELIELAHARRNSYVAHLGGPEVLGEQVWTEARRRGWEQAQDTLVLGDGAPWIWNQAALHFGASHQLVDWYHAKQHLAVAGQALKSDHEVARQRWLNSRETQLYQGQAARIADELTAAGGTQTEQAPVLLREAGYFRDNQRRMNYMEMREEEWPIGSGMIESGAKQFKARFCGPGMRWSRQGAENLLPVRAAMLSQRFDELWARIYNAPPN